MASRLQDVILRGLAAAKPVATAVAPGTLYHSSDTFTTERSDGTIWEDYSDSGGGSGGLHAPTHIEGGTDEVDVKTLGGYPANSALFLNGTGNFSAPPSGGGVHAITHASAGSDPVMVGSLGGFPGGTTSFLRADGTFAAPVIAPVTRYGVIGMVIDGGGSVITTGIKGFLEIPFACTILGWTLLSTDASALAGSATIDIWKDTFALYPPTLGDTITGGSKPSLSAVNKNTGGVSGWNVNITAGDILGFNVDLATTVTKVTLTLKIQMV